MVSTASTSSNPSCPTRLSVRLFSLSAAKFTILVLVFKTFDFPLQVNQKLLLGNYCLAFSFTLKTKEEGTLRGLSYEEEFSISINSFNEVED